MFNVLLVAYLTPNLADSQLRECLVFVKHIHTKYIADTPRVLLLLGLSAPINSFTPNFFEYFSSNINSFYPNASLSSQDVFDLVKDNFTGPTWVQQERAWVPDSSSRKQQFHLVHPLLTSTLRFLLDQGQYHDNMPLLLLGNALNMESYTSWQKHLFMTFYQDLALRAIPVVADDARASSESYFNTLNYFAGLHSSSESNSSVITDPNSAVFALSIWLPITNILWEHAMESISATIPFDILLDHADTAIKLFEARSQSGDAACLNFSLLYRRLCFHLFAFYVDKSPSDSLRLVKKCWISRGHPCFQNSH